MKNKIKLYHGTTKKNAIEIVRSGWDKKVLLFVTDSREYAIGFARRTWLDNTKDVPVIMVFEADEKDLISTKLTTMSGEFKVKDFNSLTFLDLEDI